MVAGYGLGMDSGLGKGEAFRMVGWWGLSLKGGFEDLGGGSRGEW